MYDLKDQVADAARTVEGKNKLITHLNSNMSQAKGETAVNISYKNFCSN